MRELQEEMHFLVRVYRDKTKSGVNIRVPIRGPFDHTDRSLVQTAAACVWNGIYDEFPGWKITAMSIVLDANHKIHLV